MTRKAEGEQSSDTREPSQPSDEFSAFEKLTRKLVRVPKSEIDAERAKQNGATSKRDASG